MKIIQIIPSLEMGGAERLVTDLSLTLKEKCNIEIITLYNSEHTSYFKKLKEKNIKVRHLNKQRGFDLKCLIKIFKFMKKGDFDIIHCHLDSLKYIGIANIFCKKKVIYTVHNLADKDVTNNLKRLYKFLFKKKIVYPIAICEKVKKSCIEYFGLEEGEIFTVYNGINLNEIEESEKINFDNENLFLKFLCVANFKDQKNHRYLIDLFEKISSKYKNSRLYMVGEGELKKIIIDYVKEKKLEDKIYFLGKRNDVYSLMKEMNVFILTSKFEGFSIAILEAMAAKMKIVVSNVGGNNEQINDKINGVTFELSENKELVIKKIDYLLEHDLENKAYKDVKEKFSISKITNDYMCVYSNILNIS